MRFPSVFKRTQGVSSADADPNSPGIMPGLQDNVMCARFIDASGRSINRLAIGYHNDQGSGTLTVSVYLWDNASSYWYKTEAPLTLTHGLITYAHAVVLVAVPQTTNAHFQADGSLQAYLRTDVTGAVAGSVHTIAWGPDMAGTP